MHQDSPEPTGPVRRPWKQHSAGLALWAGVGLLLGAGIVLAKLFPGVPQLRLWLLLALLLLLALVAAGRAVAAGRSRAWHLLVLVASVVEAATLLQAATTCGGHAGERCLAHGCLPLRCMQQDARLLGVTSTAWINAALYVAYAYWASK